MKRRLGLAAPFSELVRSGRLWRIWLRLGVQDVRLRFRRSAIGFAWIFLNLGITLAAVGFIYGNLLGQDLHEFIPYLTVGLVTWGYLTSSIVDGAHAFVSSEGYIKQISLPLYVYVFRSFVSTSLIMFLSFLVFVPVALIYAVPLRPGMLWALPGIALLMLTSFLFITILAHVHTRFRDAAQLAGALMQVAFYVTPVLFPAQLLRERGLDLMVDLNPLYHLLEIVRLPLLTGAPPPGSSYEGVGVLIVGLAALGGGLMSYYGRRIVFWL